jgi:hypothetical protein
MAASSLIGKLLRLSGREYADLVMAQLALCVAQLRVWARPRGRLVVATSPAPAPAAGSGDAVAARLARAVSRAARFGLFRPQCLVRAVALNQMLEARGIRGSQIRIGVRWLDGQFQAHAWVEYEGRVLGDREDFVTAYSPLTDVRLVDPS